MGVRVEDVLFLFIVRRLCYINVTLPDSMGGSEAVANVV